MSEFPARGAVYVKNFDLFAGSHFEQEIRNTKNFKKSNMLIFDIDNIENVEEVFLKLSKESLIHWMFRSPSGNGIKFGVLLESYIVDSNIYTKVYKYASKKFSEFYGIELDHTSDCARACFLSFDQNYHYNENSEKFPIQFEVEKPVKTIKYTPTEFESDPNKEYQILQDICRQLTINNYEDWYQAGMSLATQGHQGEELFCLLSLGKGHKDSESSVRRKFRTFKPHGGITISTIYYLAKNNGIDVSELKRKYYCN